jgi:hypothetical protein
MGCKVATGLTGTMLVFGAILSGCSGSAPPSHSAPQACKDFRSWWLAQGGSVVAGKDKALLARAVDQAPSGHLYRAMSTLESNVSSAVAAQGTSLGISAKTITTETALTVAQDCQSVNTSS